MWFFFFFCHSGNLIRCTLKFLILPFTFHKLSVFSASFLVAALACINQDANSSLTVQVCFISKNAFTSVVRLSSYSGSFLNQLFSLTLRIQQCFPKCKSQFATVTPSRSCRGEGGPEPGAGNLVPVSHMRVFPSASQGPPWQEAGGRH